MEEFKKKQGPKPLDWRAYMSEDKLSSEQKDTLDMVADLAVKEGIDIKSRADEHLKKLMEGPGKPAIPWSEQDTENIDYIDALTMWAYTKGLITAEEYRSFQTKN